jgi:hypothetical protein
MTIPQVHIERLAGLQVQTYNKPGSVIEHLSLCCATLPTIGLTKDENYHRIPRVTVSGNYVLRGQQVVEVMAVQ